RKSLGAACGCGPSTTRSWLPGARTITRARDQTVRPSSGNGSRTTSTSACGPVASYSQSAIHTEKIELVAKTTSFGADGSVARFWGPLSAPLASPTIEDVPGARRYCGQLPGLRLGLRQV